MSYILDALQRNEAESNPDAAANLALNQDLKRRERRNMLIGAGVIIALVVNAVLLFWLVGPDDLADAPIKVRTADAAPANGPATQTPGASREQTPATPARTTAEATRRVETTPAVATSAPTRRPTAKPVPTRILTLQQLPAAQRNRFPQLTFTSHIYADAADLRAVVVNGRRLEEGQRLGAVVLESITTDGVVVRFEDYRVELSVLEAWAL